MTDAECAAIAEQYLSSRSIGYLRPAQVRRREPTRIEIVFSVLDTEDPAVAVVDPPDIRVWVHLMDGSAALIDQM
jgi:hypothetical protein